ncbi:glutaminase domain-containing protein [Planctomycetota bacterium]
MEKKKLRLILAFVVVCLAICLSSGAGELAAFCPPAVPLVTVDPYMSVWSFSDHLYDSWPVHWTGQVHAMAGMVRVDGKTYRFMGPKAICSDVAKQTSVQVKPTRTFYTFEAGGVELRVIFLTPMLASDLSLLTSPVTFITFQIRALDKKPHAVTVYFDVSGEWVVNKPAQKIVWRRMPNEIGDKTFISIGSAEQPILEKDGDNVRIDWGYLYVGAPGDDTSRIVATSHNAREKFIETGAIPREDDTRMPRSANDDWPVIACTMNLDTKDSKPVRQTIVLAYDDIFSIEYMCQKLRPWYYQVHDDFVSMLKACIEQYPAIWKKCCAFDYMLLDDARRIGGEAYTHLVSISYRHTWASGKVVISPDGSEPWFFHKECFSNGCMATVDVSYPASPFFALFSPTLLNGMIAPVFEYAASEQWPYEFAPHDVGRYPKGNGQAYSRDRKTGKLRAERQMPVEECGNMILMTAAGAKASGSAAFAQRYWNLLSQWANYLKDKGLDPEHQLCTDDFTGHLAHNVNLSLKAINALGGYAMLCDMLGKKDEAQRFWNAAKQMAGKWQKMADDGDHYRLAFDKPGTWSMKYNLVWDEILRLELFDPEIARREVAYYLQIQNTYGLPLDNRADFTKSDWLVWCATLAAKKGDFEKLIHPLYRFTHESPDRVPFSDWYFTSTAKVRGFRARPVIGGVFIPFLKDRDRWKKWISLADVHP